MGKRIAKRVAAKKTVAKKATVSPSLDGGVGVQVVKTNPDDMQSQVDGAIAEGKTVLFYSDDEGMQRTDVFGVR